MVGLDEFKGGFMTDILKKVETLVRAADDRLASDIEVLEVKDLTPLADYFVVMSAKNDRQLDAIVQAVTEAADENKIDIKDIEGKRSGRWILIDCYDIVIHVFNYEERSHYNLENIWKDAPTINIEEWLTDK